MVNISTLGVIFPNTYDEQLPELTRLRSMASIPFAARYRMIDFTLSAMVNAGISSVTLLAKRNYYSLMDHLGNGREWDLSRKRGGLNIVPPFAQSNNNMYHGRVEALCSILDYLESHKEKYVVLSDCNIAWDLDYADLLAQHVASGADVTMVYERTEIPEPIKTANYTLTMDGEGRVSEIRTDDYRPGMQNLCMNVTVIGREELIAMVKDARTHNMVYFERDILAPSLKALNVRGYEFTGYRSRIYDMRSYFHENMRLLDPKNMDALFPAERQVYTKVRDEAPVRYALGSKVSNCVVADGCVIEGEVENCVLFRGVRISKGARVKNCILMQGTVVHPGVEMEYIVTDKNVQVSENRHLAGNDSFPVYVEKNTVI